MKKLQQLQSAFKSAQTVKELRKVASQFSLANRSQATTKQALIELIQDKIDELEKELANKKENLKSTSEYLAEKIVEKNIAGEKLSKKFVELAKENDLIIVKSHSKYHLVNLEDMAKDQVWFMADGVYTLTPYGIDEPGRENEQYWQIQQIENGQTVIIESNELGYKF